MKIIKFTIAVILTLNMMGDIVQAQHYTDWEGFEFIAGRYDSKGRIEFYELQKDYTINITEYFLDGDKLPPATGQHADYYNNWARALPPCEWEFITVELGGYLTVKKGYRWDGSSYPCKDYDPDRAAFCVDEYFNFRSSLVHDALYDLMRLEYLAADHHHQLPVGDLCLDTHILWDAGDHNRRMADMMFYMIASEDGQPPGLGLHEAESDYDALRELGACKSHDEEKLEAWKYYVNELTAIATDGKVELYWRRPDETGKCPDFSGYFSPYNGYSIYRTGLEIDTFEPITIDPPNPPVWVTSYTDTSVVNGNLYIYQIIADTSSKNQDDWSNKENVVPMKGPGNALVLDGIDDYVEANTVSNDLIFELMPNPIHSFTMETWIYPEEQTVNAAILTFNTISGGNNNMIFYNGENQKFNYYDPENGYTYSDSLSNVEEWHHVAVTINEHNQGVLYVNGLKRATFETSVEPSRGARFSIGQEWDNNSTSQHLKGMIDEVRIWKSVRTQEEIQTAMNIPLRGDENQLVGLWHFDEPSDYFVQTGIGLLPPSLVRKGFDATSYANDGILMGYDVSDVPFVPSGAMGDPVSIHDEAFDKLPFSYALQQNYPNPFNPTTTITYQLPIANYVELSVYNLLGQKVATLVSEKQAAGYYSVEWDAFNYASGVYVYKIETDKGFVQSRKLILLK